jgi:hypothetical protein
MNDLEAYFHANTGKQLHKWLHYFEIYDRHFARFRGRPVAILEFGVAQGGSLQMWKHYFGPAARIFGVDVNPRCRSLEEEGVTIFIGDQGDRTFLRTLASSLPPIDILIDDGGHTMRQQIATFEEMFPAVAADGVYLCEDTHTSYWRRWGGGLRRRGSFIEHSKRLIDQLHAWHSHQPRRFAVDTFTRSAHSIHFYDSVVVIEKRPMQRPEHRKTGVLQWPDRGDAPPHWWQRLHRRLLGERRGDPR